MITEVQKPKLEYRKVLCLMLLYVNADYSHAHLNYKSNHIPVPVLPPILYTIFLLWFLPLLFFILIRIKIQHLDLSVVFALY